MMKRIKNYEQFNEGRGFRGTAKTINFILTGMRSLGHLITLNWKNLVSVLKSIPHSNKMIDVLDTLRDESVPFWMKDKLEYYKEKFGRDMLVDIKEVREFISESPVKIEKKEKYKIVLDSVKKTIDDALLEDEGFKDTLQDLKNKIVDLSNMSKERGYDSGIEYPEDWFDKPISQMEEKDLRIEMDKALDNNDMIKARFIGKYLNKNFDNNEKV